jgi:aryl-alcohol dehydrogenase-like predicted oxidoreductase
MPEHLLFPPRTLGRTGIAVTPVGLGLMEFSGGRTLLGARVPVIPQKDKNEIVAAALGGGINWFDTAELYGNGVSEASLSSALKSAGRRDGDVVIATKWWPVLRTARNIPRTIGNRLRALDGYSIDLYLVHQPFGLSPPEAEMEAMADLVEAGRIRAVGVSNFGAKRMRRAHAALQKRGLPLAVNQMPYSLLTRAIETNGVLEAAKELGVTIVAYTPLEQGVLAGKYHRHPELMANKPAVWRARFGRRVRSTRALVAALEEIGSRHRATAAQVALNWVISVHGETIVAIPAATTASQASENAGAMTFRLSDAELARLDDLSRPRGW